MRPTLRFSRSTQIAAVIACVIGLTACGSSGTITAKGDPVPSGGSDSGTGGAIGSGEPGAEDPGSGDPGADDPITEDADPGSEPAPSGDAMALGTSGTIGDWEVSIEAWNPDATGSMTTGSATNSPPEQGAYGLVSIVATYNGASEGSAWFELTFGLAGGDGQEFKDTECNALEANGLVEQPAAGPGETVSADVCLDFDPASLDGATLFVEETISFDESRLVWNPS